MKTTSKTAPSDLVKIAETHGWIYDMIKSARTGDYVFTKDRVVFGFNRRGTGGDAYAMLEDLPEMPFAPSDTFHLGRSHLSKIAGRDRFSPGHMTREQYAAAILSSLTRAKVLEIFRERVGALVSDRSSALMRAEKTKAYFEEWSAGSNI